ncbi:MAG: hypothetical protein U0J65_05730 [Christensenellales bacterium]|nr:hypothetical protein [Christensenellales bacterium]
MMHFSFFRPVLFCAPDAGGGAGDGGAADPEQACVQEQTAPEAAAQNAPAAEGLYPAVASGGNGREERREPEQPAEAAVSDTERAQDEVKSDEQIETPEALRERMTAMEKKLGEYQLRAAAALAGVPKSRIPYVIRMADVADIAPDAADAAERYQQAIDKVLEAVPELRGGAGTGSTGNFARRTMEAADPDIAQIRRNILGE